MCFAVPIGVSLRIGMPFRIVALAVRKATEMCFLLRAPCLLMALLVAACAENPLPDSYAGPTATLSETIATSWDRGVDVFYAAALNGRRIHNSRHAAAAAAPWSYGKAVSRRIPAERVVVRIAGERYYGDAPFHALFGDKYYISGEVELTPQPGAVYRVRGEILPLSRAVWIEDVATGRPVGPKFEQDHELPPLPPRP